MSVFTHTWTATYLLCWVTVFHVDALSAVLFSFISSCQASSFLFCSKACPFLYFSFSPWVSYSSVSSFFPPYEKNNTCTKGFSPSSVLLSSPMSLISIQFSSHLERDFPDPRIHPPQKSPLKSQPHVVLYPLLSVLSLVHQFVQSLLAPILVNLWRKPKTFNKTLLLLSVAFFKDLFYLNFATPVYVVLNPQHTYALPLRRLKRDSITGVMATPLVMTVSGRPTV